MALAGLARELGIWLIPGTVLERGADGAVHNTAVVYNPQGELVADYRKIFTWRPYEPMCPGHRFVVFDMPGTGRVGLSTCYDAWYPEVTRHLAWMGAELVVNLVQTSTAGRAQELPLNQANAIANQIWVASVNGAAPTAQSHSRYVILPASGACVTVYLLTRLSTVALVIGACWLVCGFACLLWLTRGFRRPTPEFRPADTHADPNPATEPSAA
ncbi:carbon-nitrogen hydrolase family protein [Streptomyces celluloflavus]|uniref:carbon-nitrogen hydrolase family protein n=1 Tax=Streptomyces celluloflavus TaxID=58344 RepID=UPI0036D95103